MTKDELQEEMGDNTAIPFYPKVYLCDPDKNTECRKTSCYHMNMNPQYGVCKYTTHQEYSKDGKTYIYDPDINKVVEVKK